MRTAIFLLLFALPVAAQERSLTTENPLAAMMGEVTRVLADASVPFTPEQERAVVLMMEERRQASETLFGDLMDFTEGPTTGQDAERLQSAIGWMRNEFVTRVKDYLTPEQLVAWTVSQQLPEPVATDAPREVRAEASPVAAAQTQYVRINNNRFTAEDLTFETAAGGNQTQVIQRGGGGAWHGNFQTLFKDDALNARNPFAANKPPYQEREFTFDTDGPVIPGRMTLGFNLSHSLAEDVGTINATLPDRQFALGITKPTTTRSVETRSTYSFSDSNSLTGSVEYESTVRKDQNIGGFVIPERASDSRDGEWRIELTQFSALSAGSLYETNLNIISTDSKTVPFSDATKIDVLDAFNGGGSQNRTENVYRTYEFGNLYTKLGQKLTLKTGIDGTYQSRRALNTTNFGGTYVFSDIDSYLAGRATTYRVTRGEPLLLTTQLDISPFIQYDWAVSRQLTAMFGVRYDYQTNLEDKNNFSPRASIAYGLGPATVIRAGAGIFYEWLPIDRVETTARLDGTRQFEIIIDKPVYPDPFATGTVRQIFPSTWSLDANAVAPPTYVGMVAIERTLWSNLLLTATYDYQGTTDKFRLRDTNAPYDSTALPVLRSCTADTPAVVCVRPDPTRGSIINIESTGFERSHYLRITARQRFSIFNIRADYTGEKTFQDGRPLDFQSDNYDLTAENGRRPSPSHTLNTSVNARLPLGVFLTGAIRGQSTKYYTITTGRDDNRDGIVNDRPAGQRRNGTPGPKYFNLDLNLSKAFFIGGAGSAGTRKNVNMFINATNALNRTHLGNPSGVMTSRNFGRITSATNPRQIEAGLRFQF